MEGRDKLGARDKDIHTIIYKIIIKDLLYRAYTQGTTQYSIITYMGKESEKECIYVYG